MGVLSQGSRLGVAPSVAAVLFALHAVHSHLQASLDNYQASLILKRSKRAIVEC